MTPRPTSTPGFCARTTANTWRASSASRNQKHASRPSPEPSSIPMMFFSPLRRQKVGIAFSFWMICWRVSAARRAGLRSVLPFGFVFAHGVSGLAFFAASSASSRSPDASLIAASSSSSSDGSDDAFGLPLPPLPIAEGREESGGGGDARRRRASQLDLKMGARRRQDAPQSAP